MKQTSYGIHKATYFCILQDRAISLQTSLQFIIRNCTIVISIHHLKHFSQTSNLFLRKPFSYYLIEQNRDIEVPSIILDLLFKRSMAKVNIKYHYVMQHYWGSNTGSKRTSQNTHAQSYGVSPKLWRSHSQEI